MSSLDGINYGAFAPHVTTLPTVADYFGQGQALAQSVIDQQYQTQVRQNLLAEQARKQQLEALLGPIQVQQASANLTGTNLRNTYDQSAYPLDIAAKTNANTIGAVDAQYAGANAYNSNLSNRINLSLAQRALQPATTYDAAGNVVAQTPKVPLAGAGPSDLPTDSSSVGASPIFGTVRTTTYGINDPQSDPETAAGKTSTGAPVIPASPGMAGTAAVDPTKIPYGSIIKLKDGSTYVAGDTGGAVKSQTASGGQAPVIDLVGRPGSVADWNDVTITPPTTDYVRLTHAQKLAYHQAAAQASATPTAQVPGVDQNNLVAIGADSPDSVDSNSLLASGISPLASPFVSAIPTLGAASGIAPSAPVVNPASTGVIPLYQPSAPVAAYRGPDGRMVLGNQTPGIPSRSQMIPPPQQSKQAQDAIKDARDKGVNVEPFIIPPSPSNPNGGLDTIGLDKAVAAKTQSLPLSRLQQEFQTNPDVRAFHTAAGQANSIADNLTRFPFATRTAEADNAVEKSAAGTELPGQAVSTPSLNAVASGQTYGEKFNNFLSKTPVLGVVNAARNNFPAAAPFLVGSLATDLPSNPRNLSDRTLRNTADAVQSKVASSLPQYQSVLNRYRAQAQAEGLNPDEVFPPSEEQPFINAATRQMYPSANASKPANPPAKVRVSDGKQVIEIPNDPDKIKAAQARGFNPI